MSRYLRQTPGPIENDAGEVIGEHRGLAFYTLGQRSGLHIGGRAGAAAAPWYAAAKDSDRNALIAVQDPAHPLLLCDFFEIEDAHWFGADRGTSAAGMTIECAVKTRYRQNDLACRMQVHGDTARVALSQPARAVTPGQYAVFYRGDECLGGGVIARRRYSRSSPHMASAADLPPRVPA